MSAFLSLHERGKAYNGQQRRSVGIVLVLREVLAGDIASAAVDDQTRLDRGLCGRYALRFVLHPLEKGESRYVYVHEM